MTRRPDKTSKVSPSITLVTCGIIWRGDRFLIARRQPDSLLEPLKWEFPGGKIEFTEDPPQALKREIKEELDFDIDVGDIFCVSSHNYRLAPGSTRHILMLAYQCAYRRGEPAPRDVHSFRWIQAMDLGKYEFAAADYAVIDKLRNAYITPSTPLTGAVSGDLLLHDENNRVEELKQEISRFVAERDWEQFHSPKNLSMSITIEAAELMEHFQWLTVEESRLVTRDPQKFEAVSQEIADIAAYLLSLCNMLGIDLSEAVSRKLAINRERYPLEKYWGKYTT